MKLASLKANHKDGLLVVVSQDLSQATLATDIAASLADALSRWDQVAPSLLARYQSLNVGTEASAFAFKPNNASAPMPRTYQWLDGSAFLSHSDLMQTAFNLDPIDGVKETPLMYQGDGHNFTGGTEPIIASSTEFGIDFEGELGVIVDDVPMGCTAEQALEHIKLIVQLNDISLRAFAPAEMKTGFGFIQAKPATSFAPAAITPDELGEYWQDGRVHLPLSVHWNEQWFGAPNGKEMFFGFHQLIAHAAKTRPLNAGTVIGSGTLSNADRTVGSACISELRAIEMIRSKSKPETGFMNFGDRVQMEMTLPDGQPLFGSIDQTVEQ